MEAKHTPGPWRHYTRPQPNGCPIVGTENGLMVAMMAHTVNQPEQADEAIANARVVSTAPELLDALKGMVAMYCDLVESGDAGYWDPEDTPEVKAARAAIAKAEGKDSA